jgi:hypothetical protein
MRSTLPFALVLATACASNPLGPEEVGAPLFSIIGAETEILATSGYSSFTQERYFAVSDSNQWPEVWRNTWGSLDPLPDRPAIDFEEAQVIVAALGGRLSSGYTVTVDSLAIHEQGIVAWLARWSPGNCYVLGVITAPVTLIKAPAGRRVIFKHRNVTPSCR